VKLSHYHDADHKNGVLIDLLFVGLDSSTLNINGAELAYKVVTRVQKLMMNGLFQCAILGSRRSSSKLSMARRCLSSSSSFAHATTPTGMPMKPGTILTELKIYKDRDAPVVLERSEYPEWINKLTEPLISLAKLRRMSPEEATDKEKKRYLKLIRKMKIKANNDAARGVTRGAKK
jgi:Mitochondrial ribosomal protein L37